MRVGYASLPPPPMYCTVCGRREGRAGQGSAQGGHRPQRHGQRRQCAPAPSMLQPVTVCRLRFVLWSFGSHLRRCFDVALAGRASLAPHAERGHERGESSLGAGWESERSNLVKSMIPLTAAVRVSVYRPCSAGRSGSARRHALESLSARLIVNLIINTVL